MKLSKLLVDQPITATLQETEAPTLYQSPPLSSPALMISHCRIEDELKVSSLTDSQHQAIQQFQAEGHLTSRQKNYQPTQIGRNWFTQVAAGSNKDDIGVNLGVYFKFNEGILNTGSIDAQDATTLDYSGRQAYIADTTFDPTKLTTSDKFGVAPSNTTLFVAYRVNDPTNLNARVGALNTVVGPNFEFINLEVLDDTLIQNVIASIEVENEEFIGKTRFENIDSTETLVSDISQLNQLKILLGESSRVLNEEKDAGASGSRLIQIEGEILDIINLGKFVREKINKLEGRPFDPNFVEGEIALKSAIFDKTVSYNGNQFDWSCIR